MAFFKKTKKTFNDLGTKIKGGQHTTDAELKEAEKHFQRTMKHIESVQKEVNEWVKRCNALLETQSKVANMLAKGCEDGTPAQTLCRDVERGTGEVMHDPRLSLSVMMRENFMDPLNRYLSQYKETDERLKELNRRRQRMDDSANEVAKAKRNNETPRIPALESRLETCRESYEDLNAELKQDLDKLKRDFSVFIDPVLRKLVQNQAYFWRTMADKLTLLESGAGHSIDRDTLLNYPHIITPRAESAVSKSYLTTPTTGYGTPAHGQPTPSYGQPTPSYGQPAYGQPPVHGGAPAPGAGAPPPIPRAAHRQPPPVPNVVRARGQWDFTAQDGTEVSFRAGDVLTILDQSNPDWWRAELNGQQGLIPSAYVVLL